jgi:hypothetical protein
VAIGIGDISFPAPFKFGRFSRLTAAAMDNALWPVLLGAGFVGISYSMEAVVTQQNHKPLISKC